MWSSRELDDPGAFLATAAPLLLADEARNNLILGIAGTLGQHPSVYSEFHLWLVEDDGGHVEGAALPTPSAGTCTRPRTSQARSRHSSAP